MEWFEWTRVCTGRRTRNAHEGRPTRAHGTRVGATDRRGLQLTDAGGLPSSVSPRLAEHFVHSMDAVRGLSEHSFTERLELITTLRPPAAFRGGVRKPRGDESLV